MPSPVTPRCTQSGSISIFRSLFCKKNVRSHLPVPALSLNAVFGSRIAPTSSALSARYFRIVGLLLSSVPFVVITATMPPGLAWIECFCQKIIVNTEVILVVLLDRISYNLQMAHFPITTSKKLSGYVVFSNPVILILAFW